MRNFLLGTIFGIVATTSGWYAVAKQKVVEKVNTKVVEVKDSATDKTNEVNFVEEFKNLFKKD